MTRVVSNIDKAESLLDEFLSKYSSNIIPAAEFRKFLKQHGINPHEISAIILTLSAKGKLYTFKGSNGRVYIVKDPNSFDEKEFLRYSKDPVYKVFGFINSLLRLYAETHTYVELRKIYHVMRKEYGIKSTKWFNDVKFVKALMNSGYFEGFSAGTYYYLRPAKKFLEEYLKFTLDDALLFYREIYPYLWDYYHKCYNSECMKSKEQTTD